MYYMIGTSDPDVMIYHGENDEDLDRCMKYIRKLRNMKLADSDKYLLRDFTLPQGIDIQKIDTYRQQLRDFPATVIPQLPNVVWPKLG